MLLDNLKNATVQEDDGSRKATAMLDPLCAFSGCTELFLGTESGFWKLKTMVSI